MALKEVECVLLDAKFEESIPEEGDTYDPYIEIWYRITRSDDPEDVGLTFKSVLFEEDLRDIVGMNRMLGSKEMINFTKQLNNRVDPFKMIVDTDQELVSADMIKQEDSAEKLNKKAKAKAVTQNPATLHDKIMSTTEDKHRFNYRKSQGEIPYGNNNYADTSD